MPILSAAPADANAAVGPGSFGSSDDTADGRSRWRPARRRSENLFIRISGGAIRAVNCPDPELPDDSPFRGMSRSFGCDPTRVVPATQWRAGVRLLAARYNGGAAADWESGAASQMLEAETGVVF